jgi:hypothetical protein
MRNPQQFTGHLKRRLREQAHRIRAENEGKKQREKWKSINITWFDGLNKENKHCFIRLELKESVIPNDGFHEDIQSVLEEIFREYI